MNADAKIIFYPYQIIDYFDFYKYIVFIMHLAIRYVQIHREYYVSRKIKITIIWNIQSIYPRVLSVRIGNKQDKVCSTDYTSRFPCARTLDFRSGETVLINCLPPYPSSSFRRHQSSQILSRSRCNVFTHPMFRGQTQRMNISFHLWHHVPRPLNNHASPRSN